MLFKKHHKIESSIPQIVYGRDANANEGYNRLKDNIIYYCDDGKNKVFQIESSIASEGKSTLVCNLAIALSKSGKKVCIVDLDFHKPKMHKTFNIPNIHGIVEYMLDDAEKDKLIKHTDYGVDVLNRGKTAYNASIIFTSDKFKNLISELRDMYDVILLDCPPVLQVSDYMHIVKVADAVIFVVSSGRVRRFQVKEAVSLLRRNNANIFGSVMTFATSKSGFGYNKYYHYYNKYYGNYNEIK